jgi:hypothetical protein
MTSNNDIIAFSGVLGANADVACRQTYPYMKTLPCESFEDAFQAELKAHKSAVNPRLRIHPSTQVVLMYESPQSSIKNKKNSC